MKENLRIFGFTQRTLCFSIKKEEYASSYWKEKITLRAYFSSLKGADKH